MGEWLKPAVLKTVELERVPGVRIPLPPPNSEVKILEQASPQHADGDMVIIFFDAAATTKDGVPYHNTYTWYFQMIAGQVIKATAFFDTREFDEFWSRVSPTP
jgi:uncharacterized protein